MVRKCASKTTNPLTLANLFLLEVQYSGRNDCVGGTMCLTKDEVIKIFSEGFPGSKAVIEEVGDNWAVMRLPANTKHLRPGATVSGPAMMTLTDAVMWVAIIAQKGMQGFHSVTSSLSINFLNRPKHGDLIAKAEILKLGKRLVVGEVRLYSEGDDTPVAFSTVTYAIPHIK